LIVAIRPRLSARYTYYWSGWYCYSHTCIILSKRLVLEQLSEVHDICNIQGFLKVTNVLNKIILLVKNFWVELVVFNHYIIYNSYKCYQAW